MTEGFGENSYRKGHSVKRSRPLSEPPDSEYRKIAVLVPFPKIRTELEDHWRRNDYISDSEKNKSVKKWDYITAITCHTTPREKP